MNKSAVGLTETIPDDLSETFYKISQLKLPVLIIGSLFVKPSWSPVCFFVFQEQGYEKIVRFLWANFTITYETPWQIETVTFKQF